jgi:protein-tyrosine phosphatase
MESNPYDASQFHCIVPHLYLTGSAAENTQALRAINAVALVNCSSKDHPDARQFAYLRVPIKDEPDVDLSPHLEPVVQFIHAHVLRGQNVVVYCSFGKSRSVAFVLGYLIRYHRLALQRALAFVQSKRRAADPNPGFWRQLLSFI